jgi:hypothetical protein
MSLLDLPAPPKAILGARVVRPLMTPAELAARSEGYPPEWLQLLPIRARDLARALRIERNDAQSRLQKQRKLGRVTPIYPDGQTQPALWIRT